MGKISTLSIVIMLMTITVWASGKNDTHNWVVEYGKQLEFIENKGQYNVRHTSLKDKDIRFSFDEEGKLMHFTPTGVIFHFYTAEKNKNRKKGDKTKPRLVTYHDVTSFKWVGSNSNVTIEASEVTPIKHNYAVYNPDKTLKKIEGLNGYKKLTYKNLYNKIDVVYEIHPQGGVKYSLVLHPGANVNDIKMSYDEGTDISLTDGELKIKTDFGDIIEHQPYSFYKNSKNEISSAFTVSASNEVSFKLDKYDANKTVIIDPWVVTPNFNTQWKCVWECDRDAQGNSYLIGGVMPLQLLKYDVGGNLLWTYTTPYDTTAWMGSMATDKLGNSYVTNGSVASIIKVTTAGTLDWSNMNPPGGLSIEFWSITFNSAETKLVIGGTGGALPPLPFIYEMNVNSNAVTSSVQITGGQLTPTQEVRAITACDNGKYYYLTHDTIGYFSQNLSACSNTSATKIPNGYNLSYKCEDYRRDNTGICALKAFGSHVYVNRGNIVDKRNINSGQVVGSAPIPGGGFTVAPIIGGGIVENNGIDIDICGNVYVGSKNQVVKYDQNLNQIATYPTSFIVYDVHVTTNGEIIAAGSTQNASSNNPRNGYLQRIAANGCNIQPNVNCDPSICPAGPFCATGSSVTLQKSTPGGTWSGPGVNPSTGVFNPATAGPGTHKIIYNLGCGADSINIIVSPCTALSVCRENNGNFTVSNGVAPYTWAKDTLVQNCSACIFGCALPPGCAVNANAYTNFATGTTVTPPGNYPLRVTDGSGTTFVISSANAVQPCSPCPAISVTDQNKQGVTCANANGGSATFTSSGGTGAYTYVWQPNVSSTATGNGLAAGTYNVTATDANGCTGTGTVTINPPPNSPTLSFGQPTNPSCGQNNGSVNATLANGTAPYTVTIDNGQGTPQTQTIPIAGTAPLTGLAAGTYTITVRDANQCTTVQTLTLTAANSPTITTPIAVTNEICAGQNNGGITNATATGGTGTLQWSYAPSATPANTTAIVSFPVNNIAPGNYILIVRDANNCTATSPFTIAAGPNCCNITLAASTTAPSCGQNNGSITITPTPNGTYTYTWSNSLPNQATQNGLGAGQYSVTVSETGNPSCNADTVINLNNSNGPTITFGQKTDPGCGQSNGSVPVTLAGGSAPYTVTVDNGQGTPQTYNVPMAGTLPVTGLPAGTYTVSVTDANTCSATNSITLSEPLPPVINSINATAESCAGDNDGTANVATLGGTGTITYLWSNTQTTQTITGLAPGNYSVTVSDANGCSATASAVVSAGPVCCTVNISAALTQPSCGASDGGIVLTVLPSSTYTYSWSNGATTKDLTSIPAGTYCVTVVNTADNCTKDTCFSLSNPNAPTVSNTASTPETCAGNDGTINITATGGTGTLTITWSGTAQTGGSLTQLATGTYNYTVTDANSCQATGSVTVAPATGCCFLAASATPSDASCAGNDGSINVTITTAGTTPYTYSIDGNNYQSSSSFAGLNGGNYTVYVLDGTNCGDTLSVTVGVANNSLTLNLAVVQPGCAGANGGSITANASGGSGNITYQWSIAGTGSTQAGLGAGTYSVTITDGLGCTLTQSATLNNAQPVEVEVGPDVSLCQGSNTTVTAPAGFASYVWSDGTITPDISVTQTGIYSLTVTDANGCTATDAFAATVFATPQIDLPTDTTVYENNPVVLKPVITNGTTTAQYLWEPETGLSCTNCANPVANPDDTITYTLAYTTSNNCTTNAQITINVLKGAHIYMPNMFSPNGDNSNDILLPLGVGIKSITWKVFNRWGELVFLSTDKNIGWDGTFKGIAQPAGVYVYTMQVTFMNKTGKEYKGTITLIR